LGFERNEDLVDGETRRRFNQQTLDLLLGLNGYIVHPAFAKFRIDTTFRLRQFESSGSPDRNDLGFGGDLRMFRTGATPLRLFYRHQLYDYDPPSDESAAYLLGNVDSMTRWGGNLGVRRGALRGTRVDVFTNAVNFVDDQIPQDVSERQTISWARRQQKFTHNLAFERVAFEYGRSMFDQENLRLRADEKGEIARGWTWNSTADLLRREVVSGIGDPSTTDSYRFLNRFSHRIRTRDSLDLVANFSGFRLTSKPSTRTNDLSVFYRMRPGPAWEIAPFLQTSSQRTNGLQVDANQAGMRATWHGRARRVNVGLTGNAAYSAAERDDSVMQEETDQVSYGLSGTVSRNGDAPLRAHLDFLWARNALNLVREPIVELPGLGLPASDVTSENIYSLKVNLGREWGYRSGSFFGEWRRQEGTRGSDPTARTLDRFRGGLQLKNRRFNAFADLGETRQQIEEQPDQIFRFAGARASWRPMTYLTFLARYRMDKREQVVGPDIDGEFLEARTSIRLGLLTVWISARQRTQSTADSGDITDRSLGIWVTSQYSSWLPIVTGTKRRGIIR
jgi:hypothetical protein